MRGDEVAERGGTEKLFETETYPMAIPHTDRMDYVAAATSNHAYCLTVEKLLGVEIPHLIIPVRPGRDLARLIEVAAFQTSLKASGYNPAKELNERLLAKMAKQASI